MEWQVKLGIGYPTRLLRVPRRTAHIALFTIACCLFLRTWRSQRFKMETVTLPTHFRLGILSCTCLRSRD
jgi:hypothetical protein